MVWELFANKIIQSVIFAYLSASIIKILLKYIAYDELDFMMFFRTGGMPSSHTASVTAMTTAIYFTEGTSNLFVLSLIVSMIIISDAVGVRRAAGKQAQIINKMVHDYKYFKKFKTKRLYELLGHTPKQVLMGLILGILVARMVFLF